MLPGAAVLVSPLVAYVLWKLWMGGALVERELVRKGSLER